MVSAFRRKSDCFDTIGFNVIDPGAAVEDTTPYWVDLMMNCSAYSFVGLLALAVALLAGTGLLWRSFVMTHGDL